MEKRQFETTISLEFYIDSEKKIFVKYNNLTYEFIRFWKKVPLAPEICRHVYTAITERFPNKFNEVYSHREDWVKVFIKFINKYFYLYDDYLDVLIKRNGEVDLHLEA